MIGNDAVILESEAVRLSMADHACEIAWRKPVAAHGLPGDLLDVLKTGSLNFLPDP
jgi:hypothetical protein